VQGSKEGRARLPPIGNMRPMSEIIAATSSPNHEHALLLQRSMGQTTPSPAAWARPSGARTSSSWTGRRVRACEQQHAAVNTVLERLTAARRRTKLSTQIAPVSVAAGGYTHNGGGGSNPRGEVYITGPAVTDGCAGAERGTDASRNAYYTDNARCRHLPHVRSYRDIAYRNSSLSTRLAQLLQERGQDARVVRARRRWPHVVCDGRRRRARRGRCVSRL
jgi:hypothetical protein